MKFISPAVHISCGCGKPHSSYLYRLQFHVSPSGDTPAPSSCWYSWPPPLYLHHFWHSPQRDISAWLPTKKTTRSLSAGSDSWCLSTPKHFSDQGHSAPSQDTVSRADCLCTLNDTPGIFQGYWESEQEVSWFKNGSPMLREPAETRGQRATKWANCKHQSIYKHWKRICLFEIQIDFHVSFGGSFLKANHTSINIHYYALLSSTVSMMDW